MRLEKPAVRNPPLPLRSWWPAALAVVVLAIGLLAGGRLLLWAIATISSAPLTLLAAPAMLLLPGLALLRLLWPAELATAERWPLAIGVSCALPPLLLLLSAPLGLRWGPWLCWGYLAISALALLWPHRSTPATSTTDSALAIHSGARTSASSSESTKDTKVTKVGLSDTKAFFVSFVSLVDQKKRILDRCSRTSRTHLLLLAITATALLVRLYAARDLPVGMWGDSYQHTMMAQLLVDHGGLFASWEPYAALQTFTYHYGFHSNVAWLHWLSGEPVTRGLLIVGQLQSALAAPLAYLLARRLLGGERPALWAALIAGFVSAMPAYYLNWGRYTQLAGQTILPAACVVWMALLDAARDPSARRGALARLVALAVIVTAGLALTHYRVAVFAACFVLVYAAYLLAASLRSPRAAARMAGVGLATGALILLAIAPWLIRLREGALLRLGGYFLSTNVGTDSINNLPAAGEVFSLYAKPYLVALALLGIVLLAWRRRWRGLLLPAWAAAVWLAANPYLIGLTGAGIISNFTVVIAGYLVLAPLAGAAVAGACEWIARTPHAARLLDYGQVLAGALVLIWALGWQQRIADARFELFTPADATAMDWIRRETPPDARFFVNSFPAYGDTLYAGSDGGWWLPLMTGRQSNLPPLTYGIEAGEQPGYQLAVNATNAAIERHPVALPEAAAALRGARFGYLYDGPAASPPGEYIDPAALARSPLYQQVYSKDGVTIWRLR